MIKAKPKFFRYTQNGKLFSLTGEHLDPPFSNYSSNISNKEDHYIWSDLV